VGPDELVQIGYVASRYYRAGRSKIELAEELGISRFKVSRLLEKATELGIVRIDITLPDAIDGELSNELRQKFGLRRAIVVRAPSEEPEALRNAIGCATADLLPEVLKEGELVGVAPGRTLLAATTCLTPLPHTDVVALCGISNPSEEFSTQVIMRLADATDGTAWPIFAPFILPDPITATSLRTESRIKAAFDLFGQVKTALVSVGSWKPNDSQFYALADSYGLAAELLSLGAVGEVCSTVFAADGTIVPGLEDHTLSISAEQLRAIPEVIGVAGGQGKTKAVLGAVRAGLINSLVTDSELARQMIASISDPPAAG